jgi:hypothetical protein
VLNVTIGIVKGDNFLIFGIDPTNVLEAFFEALKVFFHVVDADAERDAT